MLYTSSFRRILDRGSYTEKQTFASLHRGKVVSFYRTFHKELRDLHRGTEDNLSKSGLYKNLFITLCKLAFWVQCICFGCLDISSIHIYIEQ